MSSANRMPCCSGPVVTERKMHYNDVMMSAMASQLTSLTIVYSTVYSGADQRKHQSSASLAFVRGIHRWPVSSPHKGPVTWKIFPFDDIIMVYRISVDNNLVPNCRRRPGYHTYSAYDVMHDDVIKWKHFPRNWPFMWGIHRSPVNSPHKGQWRGALMLSLICLNKQLSKQSRGWWFEAPSRQLWRHSNGKWINGRIRWHDTDTLEIFL